MKAFLSYFLAPGIQLPSDWQNMELNSSADGLIDPADHTERATVPPELIRDEFFYFDTLVFQVEMTLFRVPRHGFEVEGSLFQTLFSLPSPMEYGEQVEGRDDKCPIVLGEITKEYFRGFLRAMYPFDGITLTYDDWLGALDLATMWDFAKIRERSIKAISCLLHQITATEKVILGKKYHDLLDLNQLSASSIDWPTISKLFSIREKILKSRMETMKESSHPCSKCGKRTTCHKPAGVDDIERFLVQHFAMELGDS
ncbi:hypothetical protein M413DRAFT_448894 [Hebeloma cylindrosporum]|uniref:BTB domain-containing protein n=1 Tax=Hebeloma cylindrosporum TaxID=76867 RepID=A0A0C3BJ65_HEBCY|nr:hypothetical protein M413DRAFT_448894 [Hebeloma cylindrosporum h7]